ncbi:cell division protein ZipA [Cellvibrio mixtus]|uniref:Cell division protein ZipA n=1 Tax=Cellvibrio mixtus TaxID=39650 RepID=A0A266Q5J0_9GAMM|nr:cell division protein ZipA [Cellvibrio mixtus]OZY85105.1 cell division protein ZipA [Cellvibrio mixtus]
MKDWVIIIGTLLILLVLADGIRRKRNERMGKIKVSRTLKKSLKQQPEDEEDHFAEAPSYTSELPNGGARVVGKRDPQAPIPSIEKKAHAKSYTEKQLRNALTEAPVTRAQREPQQTSLNLGQAVPILMESVEDKNRSLPLDERIEPRFSAIADEQDSHHDVDDDQDEYEGEDYETEDHPYTRELDDERDEDEFDQESDYEDEYEDDELPLDDHEQDESDYDDEDYEEEDDYDDNPQSAGHSKNELAQQPAPEPEEVLIINVMAHKGEMFKGSDLLDIILKCGMRYGSMDIFHRYSDAKGEGALLFSMANMVKPGTFDLDAMDEFETPGVSLFMTLPINADSMQSFDLMADTARAIAETLNGELKDEQRSVMTRQTLEHCRQRIRDFERTRLFRRPPRH